MKTLGPATKAALTRIVSTLPYLRENEAAVPTGFKTFWQGIKQKYASKHSPQGASDPLHDAALAHAEEEISKALEEDEKSENVKSDELAAEQPTPVVPEGTFTAAEEQENPTQIVAPVETSNLPPGDLPPESIPVPEKDGE